MEKHETIKPETIMRLGAEGGSITVYGTKTWQYAIETNDSTAELTNEEPARRSPIVVNTWSGLLATLDSKYPWTKLTPLTVAPRFRTSIWKAIQSRVKGAEERERWKKKCKPANVDNVHEEDRRAWPELVYRLVEHYKWEPQWLYKGEPAHEFYKGIRQQEVPLNFLF